MNQPRSRALLGWPLLLLIGALIALVLAAMVRNPLDGLLGETEEFVDRGPVVVQSVRNLSELSTVEVVESTTVEAGEDGGVLDFATGDRIFLFAVARISAGIDLQDVGPEDVTINDETNSIRLRLPSPTITSVQVDNEQTRVYDRDTGLFTRGDPDLERVARQIAEDEMVDAALQDGLLDRAEDSTDLAMRELLTSLGWSNVDIQFSN